MIHKATLKEEIRISGVGVHSGEPVKLWLKPSEAGRIVFRRTDLDDLEFELDPAFIEAKYCTALVTGSGKIHTIEHLMAVLFMAGVDSLVIEVKGSEIPILDGSARIFAEAVAGAGLVNLPEQKKIFKITKGFCLQEKDTVIEVFPDTCFRMTYMIDFNHPAIGKQELSLVLEPAVFLKEIAPARTFGFLKDVPFLREQGFALGGSLENALVLDDTKVINGPLRFPDEFVRHKILDLIGDFSLLGAPILGHIKARKAGHSLHQKAVRYLLEHPDHFNLS
jgi:UDP-3-O-[3-hydroxymyristoyl] N-acetylglucosamine deacetylase